MKKKRAQLCQNIQKNNNKESTNFDSNYIKYWKLCCFTNRAEDSNAEYAKK